MTPRPPLPVPMRAATWPSRPRTVAFRDGDREIKRAFRRRILTIARGAGVGDGLPRVPGVQGRRCWLEVRTELVSTADQVRGWTRSEALFAEMGRRGARLAGERLIARRKQEIGPRSGTVKRDRDGLVGGGWGVAGALIDTARRGARRSAVSFPQLCRRHLQTVALLSSGADQDVWVALRRLYAAPDPCAAVPDGHDRGDVAAPQRLRRLIGSGGAGRARVSPTAGAGA